MNCAGARVTQEELCIMQKPWRGEVRFLGCYACGGSGTDCRDAAAVETGDLPVCCVGGHGCVGLAAYGRTRPYGYSVVSPGSLSLCTALCLGKWRVGYSTYC